MGETEPAVTTLWDRYKFAFAWDPHLIWVIIIIRYVLCLCNWSAEKVTCICSELHIRWKKVCVVSKKVANQTAQQAAIIYFFIFIVLEVMFLLIIRNNSAAIEPIRNSLLWVIKRNQTSFLPFTLGGLHQQDFQPVAHTCGAFKL